VLGAKVLGYVEAEFTEQGPGNFGRKIGCCLLPTGRVYQLDDILRAELASRHHFQAAYDGQAGDKILHVEAGALIRSFRFVTPVGTKPTMCTSSNATAASGEVNANLEFVKNVRLIANTLFGSGGGPLPVWPGTPMPSSAPIGSISAVHSYSTVDGFEADITKNTLISMLYGGAYFESELRRTLLTRAVFLPLARSMVHTIQWC
jgi:hypothetical protein